ncbi:proprotein convertase subtilisin:kexin type 5 [Echinococcus multilocularis]|uniref:Proprotein convertase subtilisin:kexin type 5 n=1 Tax=Echinococcus multilocularis TaxID=6211 RepID=A0A068YJ20_ECHMU|nr:proprotein convertase subtilisin:kexin type 5 [Echinococcus multilocularis]
MTLHLLIKCLSADSKLVNEFVIEIAVEGNARHIIESMGFEFIRKIHGYDYTYLAKLPENSFENATKYLLRIKRNAEVVLIEQQKQLIRTKRDVFTWNDLKYPDMWYLNRASNKDSDEVDLNVQEAWQLGYSGKGVVVTIMDDGLDHTHPDLSANYAEQASWDVNNGDRDPMPNTTNPDNKHGTRCAGQVAAVGNNSVCIVGVAFNALIGGIRMLDGTITDRVEAESLNFNQNYIDIYSGSWGPDDTGQIYEGPGRMASEAFHKGATTGRNGLGNVFVWASGNGGRRGDSCAADGYVSSIYTLAVSSVTEHNTQPWYLEKCAAILVSTYSSGGPGESGIVTTDLNHGCTNSHTGTSASAPLAVGIIALMLEANPKLTWRDVQYLTVLTANTKPFKDGDFTKNGVGYLYSNYYGFGLMDAGKAVRLSELWRTLPPHHRCTTNVKHLSRDLSVLFSETYTFNFTGCRPFLAADSSSGRINEEGEPIAFVEHIQVFMTVRYDHRGLVRVRVVSPSGTVSELMPVRLFDAFSKFDGIDRWPLMSVQFWGEPSAGEWKIIIDNMEGFKLLSSWKKQQEAFEKSAGQWDSVHMVAYGTESFPIRLKPPSKERQPPKPWFDRFAQYVVSDDEMSPTGYTCHSQCATNECWGPSANQCLKGCKNFVTESGQCVSECPMGTTALISAIVSDLRAQSSSTAVARGELRCERCFPACAECLRPYSAHSCTACSGDSYLAPFLSPTRAQVSLNPRIARLLDSITAGHGNRLLVGSCVSRCPSGYFANETSKACEQCVGNCKKYSGLGADACQECAKNYRVDTAGPHRCPKGSFLKGNICVPCVAGCKVDSCSEHGLCTYCDTEHRFMHEGRCEKSCPVGFFPAFRLRQSGLYETETAPIVDDGGIVWMCAPCPPGCASCSPSPRRLQGFVVPRCDTCHKGLSLERNSGLCKSSCPVGTYGQNCTRTCHHMCLTCLDELDSCLQCSSGAYLAYGEHRLDPFIIFTSDKPIGYGCVNFCPEATYAARIDGELICLPCPPLCKSCAAPDKCTRCEEGYALRKRDGKCEPVRSCSQATYFDNSDQKCKPCHPSCVRCRGSGSSDCLECPRLSSGLSTSPACLEPPLPMRATHISQEPLLESPVGTCYPCCHVARILDSQPPSGCLFCLPTEITCSSWAAIGGGLGLYENYTFLGGIADTPLEANGSGWAWVGEDPVRLSFFITAILTVAIALGYLVYHLTTKRIRKRHIRNYHSLFLSHGRTGSRLSQRCPDAGSSPVIHIQSPVNGQTNGRVPNQRSSGQSDHHHNQTNSLSNVSPTTDNRNRIRAPSPALILTRKCKHFSPFPSSAKSSRSLPKMGLPQNWNSFRWRFLTFSGQGRKRMAAL